MLPVLWQASERKWVKNACNLNLLFFMPVKIKEFNSFLKAMLEYFSGIKFLPTCSVIFLRVVITKTRGFAKCHATIQTHNTGFFPSFMCRANSTLSRCCIFLFFTWWDTDNFMNFKSAPQTGSRICHRWSFARRWIRSCWCYSYWFSVPAIFPIFSLSAGSVIFWTQSSRKPLKA